MTTWRHVSPGKSWQVSKIWRAPHFPVQPLPSALSCVMSLLKFRSHHAWRKLTLTVVALAHRLRRIISFEAIWPWAVNSFLSSHWLIISEKACSTPAPARIRREGRFPTWNRCQQEQNGEYYPSLVGNERSALEPSPRRPSRRVSILTSELEPQPGLSLPVIAHRAASQLDAGKDQGVHGPLASNLFVIRRLETPPWGWKLMSEKHNSSICLKKK